MTTAVHPSSTRRRKRALRIALLAAAIGLVAAACNPDEATLMDLTNGERTMRGIPALEFNLTLWLKANSWANKMAADGRLSHSNLADGNPYNWKLLGENVGVTCGGSVLNIHQGFMNSPGHRANILDPRFNYFAIAAIEANGCIWVVEEFMQL
jgi:uncharacterized protein YkwD